MGPSVFRALADLLLVGHLAFVLFVVLGGLLALRWPRAAWVHLPAAAWGVAVEWAGWICPLTPLEARLRVAAGQEVAGGDFIARVVLPLLYPAALTRTMQVTLGLFALAVNVAIYAIVLARRRRHRAPS